MVLVDIGMLFYEISTYTRFFGKLTLKLQSTMIYRVMYYTLYPILFHGQSQSNSS